MGRSLITILKKRMKSVKTRGLLITLLVLIGSIGIVMQLKSHAATTFVTSEAEKGVTTSPATLLSDVTASGGNAVKFASVTSPLLVDEQFNGTTLNTNLWSAKSYPKGYRNGEEEDYRPSQVAVANGTMLITASRDASGAWHSGEVESVWSYPTGSFQTRMKVTGIGPGVWPADWMMGRNGQWPTNGEIDTLEEINGKPTAYGTIHGKSSSGNWQLQTALSPFDITQYHVYRIDKTPGDIKWYIDDLLRTEWRQSDTPAGATWPFENNTFYGLFNIAIGGSWPGPSSSSTPNPVVMSVDWYTVRAL